jgi:hypothetical protein
MGDGGEGEGRCRCVVVGLTRERPSRDDGGVGLGLCGDGSLFVPWPGRLAWRGVWCAPSRLPRPVSQPCCPCPSMVDGSSSPWATFDSFRPSSLPSHARPLCLCRHRRPPPLLHPSLSFPCAALHCSLHPHALPLASLHFHLRVVVSLQSTVRTWLSSLLPRQKTCSSKGFFHYI